MRARLTSIAIGLAWIAPLTGLPAQAWYATLQAGRIRSTLDPAGDTPNSFALGLRFDDASTGLRVSAGVPTSAAEPLWGGAGAWKRLSAPFGRVRAGIDLAANAFASFDRAPAADVVPGPFDPPPLPSPDRSGSALAGQVLPVLGVGIPGAEVQARYGLSRYAAWFGDATARRSVQLADVQVTWSPVRSLAVVPVLRRVAARRESPATFAGLSLVGASSSGSAWASVGTWRVDAVTDAQWSAGARVQVHPQLSLEAGVRHDGVDPLYLQPAQTAWSVGASVLLARPRTAAPPVPSAYADGRATIRLPVASSGSQPSIAGDFNDWKPAPMQRAGAHWTYTVAVQPGVYNYAFVRRSGEWFVPRDVPGRKEDGMGGWVAVLVVR